jgi:hypothetical protein
MSQYDGKPNGYGPPAEVPPFDIEVEPESKLEGLVAMLENAQSEAKAAEERFKGLKDQIKSEVSALAPGRERIVIHSKYLAKPWVMRSQESWNLDSKMLKAKEPLTWVKYATKRVTWFLEASKDAKTGART